MSGGLGGFRGTRKQNRRRSGTLFVLFKEDFDRLDEELRQL